MIKTKQTFNEALYIRLDADSVRRASIGLYITVTIEMAILVALDSSYTAVFITLFSRVSNEI
jgi:hypothetical protein